MITVLFALGDCSGKRTPGVGAVENRANGSVVNVDMFLSNLRHRDFDSAGGSSGFFLNDFGSCVAHGSSVRHCKTNEAVLVNWVVVYLVEVGKDVRLNE